MAFENSGVPWATQAGSFPAELTRRAVFSSYARTSANTPGIISGGLISSADLQLSNAVSGLVVYVSTGEAIIPGNEGGVQGGYYGYNSTQISITLATANASNPRIDLICLTVDDTGYAPPTGGTGGQVTAQAVTGTPTSGATLTNLSGVGSLPGSSLLLGYVLVPAAATNLTSGDIKNAATPCVLGLTAAQPTYAVTTVSGSRAYGTAYQPNVSRATLVNWQATTSGACGINLNIGATSTPTIQTALFDIAATSGGAGTLTAIVPPAWYYKASVYTGTASTFYVTETIL